METCARCKVILDVYKVCHNEPTDEWIRVFGHRDGKVGIYKGKHQVRTLCAACGEALLGRVDAFVSHINYVSIDISDARLISKLPLLVRALSLMPAGHTSIELIDLGSQVLVKLRGPRGLDVYTVDLQTGVSSPVAYPEATGGGS
jgi:hypothetical protein